MFAEKKLVLKKEAENIVIRKDKSIEYKIDNKDIDISGNHRLFFSCEDSSSPTLKNESGAELLYMLIDDSLNYEKAEKNKFCLDLSCKKPLPYAKRVLKKVMWQPLKYGLFKYDFFNAYQDNWSFGVMAKADNLCIENGGYLRIRADVWYVKDGVNYHDTTASPDETYIKDICAGTYSYTVFKEDIKIDEEKTACVIVTLEGENYSGEVCFECPFLSDFEGKNLLPEFERGNIGLTDFAWLGQNLNKRDWPEFEVSVNGKVVFNDEVFLKIHRFSPVEIPLPKGCFNEGENTISLKYVSDYIDTAPLLIDEVVLLETVIDGFELVRCPKEVAFGKEQSLLAEVENSDTVPAFESEDFELTDVTTFPEFNLVVYSIKPLKEENNLKFSLKYEDKIKCYDVARCVRKTDDNVVSGSGDMIYVDVSDANQVCDYIKWYVANDVGSFVTIRQVYRWGGQRFVNPKVWELFTKLCEKLGLLYVHISDGRDIPGINTNPTKAMLEGKNFMGRQLHERDGQLFYWGVCPREIQAPLEEFFDLAMRMGREYPDTVEGSFRPFNVKWTEDFGYSFRRNLTGPDVEEAYNTVKKELANLSKDNYIRHTGPSVMFKYFYENGFKWTGAETMDGATEILLSFMRGASKAYDIEKTGVHLAVQWGNFPHDTEQRYKRYLLSLYVPYMHGVTDINTEEGLWFIEANYAYFNRISDVCERHRQQSKRFNEFVRTHSRTGTFYTPIAFLHGRMDGWNGFGVSGIWGMPSMPYADESESWKVAKVFYPNNSILGRGCSKTGCIPADTTKPVGIFSGTPYGCVDAIPVENGKFNEYSLLIFAGYNKAESGDLDRLYDYVSDGGTLICSWPHFSDTTFKPDLDNYNINIVNHKLVSALCDGKPEFVEDNNLKICANVADCEVVKTTENGNPLVCNITLGSGKIILVNTLYYPGNDNVFDLYKEVVADASKAVLAKEPVVVECGDDIEYTIFKQDDGTRHYYFTAVDWYNDSTEKRCAKVIFDGNTYEVSMNFGDMLKVVCNGKVAVLPENDSCEVVDLNADSVTVQGFGKQNIYVLRNGVKETVSVDFADKSVVRIDI
ncbi:MAG: hypothetical protein IKV86_02855 [Clostridia bacterium]|nr:hypothetical protein [Clostridia bacterium]